MQWTTRETTFSAARNLTESTRSRCFIISKRYKESTSPVTCKVDLELLSYIVLRNKLRILWFTKQKSLLSDGLRQFICNWVISIERSATVVDYFSVLWEKKIIIHCLTIWHYGFNDNYYLHMATIFDFNYYFFNLVENFLSFFHLIGNVSLCS